MSNQTNSQHFENTCIVAASEFKIGRTVNLQTVSRCISRMSALLVQAEAQMIEDSREHVARAGDRRK